MILCLNEDIINEAVSGQEVIDALDNKRAVLITYDDEQYHRTQTRYIEPYVYGLTKAGNPCIRAYQYWGDTKRGVPKWKMFRLDRVLSWKPTEQTFELEPQARGWAAQAYNNNGDGSMSSVFKTVDLGDQSSLTDYEKLKLKTKQLKNSKPLNINDFKAKIKADTSSATTTNNPGPIVTPNQDPNQPQNQPQAQELQNQNGEVEIIQQEVPNTQVQGTEEKPTNQTGPIQTNEPENNRFISNDVLDSDDFKKMLQRNLELTDKEKKKRGFDMSNS